MERKSERDIDFLSFFYSQLTRGKGTWSRVLHKGSSHVHIKREILILPGPVNYGD